MTDAYKSTKPGRDLDEGVMLTIRAEKKIMEMRKRGKDWGQIAGAFGVAMDNRLYKKLEMVMTTAESVSHNQLLYHCLPQPDFHR